MARSTPGLGQRGIHFLTSTATLATWRWRRQWFLLLVTGVGMVAAIMLVCSIPLFSAIMLTAGLRGTASATPQSSQISVTAPVAGLSTQGVQQATGIITSPLQQRLGTYLQGPLRLEVVTPKFGVEGSIPPVRMSLYGESISSSRPHLTLLKGRLPSEQSKVLEVALTSSVMKALGLHVGSTIVIQSVAATRPYGISNGGVPLAYPVNISLQVVGSFQARDAETYWHGNDFELSVIKDKRVNVPPVLQGLVSSRTLLSYFDAVAHNELLAMQQQDSPLIGEPGQSDQVYFPELPTLYYYAALNPTKINLTVLDNLINRLAGVQTGYSALMAFANPTFPYIEQITPSGDMFSFASHPSILEKFRDQLAIVQVPTAILGLQITALVLFFVSVMAGLLVDRQAEAIAVLRSRGASGRQVLGSLVTQGLGTGLFALLIGPPLALIFVYAVAARLLPSASQDALDVITNSPMQALNNVAWYALAAVGVTLLTMLFSLYRAARLDIVSVRREITRSTRRPLWQRLRLDIWGVVVALTGYALSLYLVHTTQFLDAQARVLVTSPLTMIAPIFLILAGVLAFLRFFPMLLHLISTIALRGRSASSMLALAHMARSPRQPLRMSLLLGLATAFTIFSLVLFASQAQRTQDLAAYQVGSDFTGSVPLDVNPLPMIQETAQYRQVAGVTSATVGYVSNGAVTLSLGASATSSFAMQIRAVDTTTYARTTYWNAQDSTQALPDLLAQLQAWRQRGLQQSEVPALVDASAWNSMHLHVGSTFSIAENNSLTASAHYLAVAEVEHIPTVDDNASGGVLVDFATMQAVQAHNFTSVPLNTLWLRTSSDPVALTHLRALLTTSRLRLDNLSDRRVILAGLASDPLALDLLGILSLGTSTALLLALVANILTPLLSVRARLTSFTILRALGAAPGQVVRILAWEQSLIFVLALLLGCLFGTLLSWSVVPNLVFTGVLASDTATSGVNQLFAIQQLLPTQIVIPASLAVALLVLVGICALALDLIGRVVLRPAMGQALRINED